MTSIVETLNQSIGANESGLQFITEGDAVTIASTNGLGRLSPRIVGSLAENRTSLASNSAMMEVLQVPLIGLEAASENLLTLADGDLDGVLVEDETLWHWGPAGFGFETNNTSWVWRVPSSDIINDVSIDQGFGFAAYGDGLVVGNASDDEETTFVLEDKEMVAVVSQSSTWFAIEANAFPTLWYGDVVDANVNETLLNLSLPSTILDWELQVDENDLFLRVEGLLSESFYKRSLSDEQQSFVEIEVGEWPMDTTEEPAVCPGVGTEANLTHAWCIEGSGMILRSMQDNSVQSMRLPILSDAGGFGTLPQMFFALDGDASSLLVDEGQIRIGERLEPLSNIEQGNVTASGLFQYAFGSDESLNLTINGSFVDDERLSSLSDLDPVILGLINMNDAEFLAAAEQNERSMLVFSNVSNDEMLALELHLDAMMGVDDLFLPFRLSKSTHSNKLRHHPAYYQPCFSSSVRLRLRPVFSSSSPSSPCSSMFDKRSMQRFERS